MGRRLRSAAAEASDVLAEIVNGAAAPRRMPRQKPGESKQDVETPQEFIDAVEARFGPLDVDLAANEWNAKAPVFYTPEQDSLAQDWAEDNPGSNMWLNPEFGDIARFAAKCAEEGESPRIAGGRILMLVPAAVGTVWFRNYVHGRALSLALSPRIKFVGHRTGFPKDLMLCIYSPIVPPGFDVWRWKK